MTLVTVEGLLDFVLRLVIEIFGIALCLEEAIDACLLR
jgi:hypothetical protein